MVLHHYIIGLGSNCCAKRNLDKARHSLSSMFPSIRFAPAEFTRAVGMKLNSVDFLNQIATFESDLSLDETKKLLKEIEKGLGRTEEEKSREIIRIDIDIITYDEEIIKSADYKLSYVKRGITFLDENSKSVKY